jgi:CHAT domain-containing protein/Tfp pilus assembly protein PilF
MVGDLLPFLKRLQQGNNCLLILSLIWLILILGFTQHAARANLQSPNNESQVNHGVIQQTTEPILLETGKPIVREMKGGDSHSYAIRMAANQYLQAVVEQKGIDVVVAVYDPNGKKVYEIDSPNGTQGPEPVYLITESSGQYRLEVLALEKEAKLGKYEAKIEEIRAAIDNDKPKIAAYKAEGEAELLNAEGKLEKIGDIIAKYEEAIKLFQIANDQLGESQALNKFANFYYSKRDYNKAEQFFQRALAIREKALGAEHPSVANTIRNLALLYEDKGDYIKAEPLYQRALAIREKAFGPDRPIVADTLNDLAILYIEKGDYGKVEPLYQRALAIYEKAFGPDSASVATALNNLASLYQYKGDYNKAEQLLQRTLAIREKVLGMEHPAFANSLNNLASLYDVKGDYDKAEPLYQRALAIEEKTLGPDHPDVAASLNNLADLYKDKGDYNKAEQLFQRALAIREKALGTEHPDFATSLNDLANLYEDKGDYIKAEPLYQRALAIREKALGTDHFNSTTTKNNLAVLYRSQGNIEQAIKYKEGAGETRERELIKNLAAGSEKSKLAYLNLTAFELDQTISLHLISAVDNKAAARLALTGILRRKGRALDAMTDSIAILRRRANKEDGDLLDQLADTRAQYSALSLRGPGKEGIEQHKANLKALEDQMEKLEQRVSSRSAEFKVQSQPISLAAVQQAIPVNAVLIEFAAYQQLDEKNKSAKRHFAVYVLTSNGEPLFADLGEAETIEHAISALRKILPDKQTSIEKEVKPAARVLDELVMKPVRKLIGDKKRLLIAPDGALNLIPFDALVDEQGKYLVDNYQITYLTSGRDLLRLQNGISSRQPTTIMANPEFGSDAFSAGDRSRLFKYQKNQSEKGANSEEIDFSQLHFSSLPGTAQEAKAIITIFPQGQLFTQSDASKENLFKIDAPEILHIATHGFFLLSTDGVDDNSNNSRGLALDPIEQSDEFNKSSRKLAIARINPLLRSGLALAQANQHAEIGILTALEATGLNLWGTKLVVLSACDTGVGEVKNGDGVYGLRRALVLAGSETQMMSLWPVSDIGTRELMTSFYSNLKAGMGRSAALRDVQLKMIAEPTRSHPFYWASFILSGEWANLDGRR